MYLKDLIKKLIVVIVLQGVVLGQSLINVNVKGVEVPVIFEQSKSLPIISMQVVFGVSGSIKDGERQGLARFSSQVLGEGTLSLGGSAFAASLEEKAVSLHAQSGTENFIFELASLKEQFDYGIGKLIDLLKEPNLSKEAVEKVRMLTLGMLSNKVNDFDYVASVELKKLLHVNQPIGHANSGDMESVKKIKLEDVKKFLDSHLDISNATVVIGGDISQKEVEKYVKDVLSTLKVGEKRELPFYETSNKKEKKIIKKESEQAYIYFGAPFFMKSNDEEGYKAKVAAFILGESGFGSRLMEEIRVKRGLAYSAYGRISVNRSYSQFSGHLQTKNESLDEAVKIVKEVVSEFVKNGVTQDELSQAKRFLLGSEPLRNETLSQRLSRSYFEIYRGFYLGHSKEQLKKIEALTLDELNAFIKSHSEIEDISFSIVTNDNSKKQK